MYKYEILENEYIRICPECWCASKDIIRDFNSLIEVVRKVDNLFDNSL